MAEAVEAAIAARDAQERYERRIPVQLEIRMEKHANELEWIEHQRYRVKYRYEDSQKVREFVGTSMGMNQDGLPLFNLRPDGGTSTLLHDAIVLEREEVDNSVPHTIPQVNSRKGSDG